MLLFWVMTAPTHVLSGLAASVVLGRFVGLTPSAVHLIAVIAGSIAPDIDGNGSITRPGTILRRFLGRGLADALDALALAAVKILQLFFKHRGFIHSPCMAIAILVVAAFLGQAWLVWFGVGYAAHFVGDALTAGGIPMLSPFSERRVSLSTLRTGSGMEVIVACGLLVFVCVCGWTLLPEAVQDTHRQLFDLFLWRLNAEWTVLSSG